MSSQSSNYATLSFLISLWPIQFPSATQNYVQVLDSYLHSYAWSKRMTFSFSKCKSPTPHRAAFNIVFFEYIIVLIYIEII